MIDIEIDKLTRSIEDSQTGRSLQTVIEPVTSRELRDLATEGWSFNWLEELKDSEVYKLTVPNVRPVIQELISLTKAEGFIQVGLVESHPLNVGQGKKFRGVAGNLFAFAAKISMDVGNDGFVMFVAKTELIEHYERTLGAKRMGGSSKMYLDERAAGKLISQYFGGSHAK